MKKIVIIGGGISGLALLHFLHKKYAGQPGVDIILLERETRAGGTIATQDVDGALFENGPNGFLDNQTATLELVRDLGLEGELICAKQGSQIRYLRLGDKLHAFPTNSLQLFSFTALSLTDKLRILAEPFVPKGGNTGESVHDFAKRRFGAKTADLIFDCAVSGIYGGDSRKLNMCEAFGNLTDMEQKYGSIIKGLILRNLSFPKSSVGNPDKAIGRAKLLSFKKGMGQLIAALVERYRSSIHLAQEIKDIRGIKADEIFVCTPAHAAADILHNSSPVLAQHLRGIHYAPMAVAGLVYHKSAFDKPPKGFGYLVPSQENKTVLGVLFESNIFTGRVDGDHVLARVMMGGSRHPQEVFKPAGHLLRVAHESVADVFPTNHAPVRTALTLWPKAIPQYDQDYARLKPLIVQELSRQPHIHLAANYWNGVSFNDCIKNAKNVANIL